MQVHHAVATAIYGAARAEDRVYRYGGDEFALILDGVSAADAGTVGERVRAAVARLTAREADRVTITVGVAAFPDDAPAKNDLIAAADTALYYGKQSGGDRVVRADEVPREMRDLRSTLDRLARAALRHPDDPASVDTLVEQAARLSGGSATDGAESVRDALLAVARSLNSADPGTIGHGDRVGLMARRLAVELGSDEDAAGTIELAARLHGLQVAGARELNDVPSLREVGRIVGWRHEAGDDSPAPLGAQILAIANAYDRLTTGAAGARRDRRAAVEELGRLTGQLWGTPVLEALSRVVAVPPRRGTRRRRYDGVMAERETDAA